MFRDSEYLSWKSNGYCFVVRCFISPNITIKRLDQTLKRKTHETIKSHCDLGLKDMLPDSAPLGIVMEIAPWMVALFLLRSTINRINP